jgi:ABC-type transport system substrate-binding protein
MATADAATAARLNVYASAGSGLYREWGRQTDQIVPPGQDGHTGETHYPYDLDRAKKLLAKAGYADGFTLPVLTTTEAERRGFAPVSFQPTFVYTRNTVIDIDLTTERPGPNPTEWAPA